MEKQINIPALRFPTFKGEWEKQLGSKVFEPISNKTHNSDLPILAISQEYGAVPREMINYQITVSEKSIDGYKVIEKGDFIISLRSFQGGIEYSNYKGICSPAYIILRSKVEINDNFYKIYFKSNNYIQALCSKLEGIRDGKMISYKYFSEIAIPTPTLAEQKRIASFFTVLDKKIIQLKTKKEKLQQYKKGVMQQLFSQKLRFKDKNGKAFADWEMKKLGEVIQIQSSKRVLQQDWTDKGIPFYRTREIINLSNGDDFRTPIFITEELFENIKLKYGIPNEGDMLVTGVGTIGQTYVVKKFDKFYFKDGNVLWFKLNKKINSEFLNQTFKTKFIKRQLSDNASITTVATFTIDGARKTIINLPCLGEQTKIANFLSSIDEKINHTENQIQQTQTWKKGLLQKMFV
jgi:type I restriction enzyme S subunit